MKISKIRHHGYYFEVLVTSDDGTPQYRLRVSISESGCTLPGVFVYEEGRESNPLVINKPGALPSTSEDFHKNVCEAFMLTLILLEENTTRDELAAKDLARFRRNGFTFANTDATGRVQPLLPTPAPEDDEEEGERVGDPTAFENE